MEDLGDGLDKDYHLKEINLETKEEQLTSHTWCPMAWAIVGFRGTSPPYSPEPGASELLVETPILPFCPGSLLEGTWVA